MGHIFLHGSYQIQCRDKTMVPFNDIFILVITRGSHYRLNNISKGLALDIPIL